MKYGTDLNYMIKTHPTTKLSLDINAFQYYLIKRAKKNWGLFTLPLYIKYGARADIVDKDENNPVHLYLINGGTKLLLSKLKLFIDGGLNLYQKNKDGKSVIHYLSKKKTNQKVFRYIQKREDLVKGFIKQETKDHPNNNYTFMLLIILLFIGNI